MPTYIEQLQQPESAASQHLNSMVGELKKLMKSDMSFLRKNADVDRDYFELKKMPHQPMKTDSKK